MVAEKRTVEVGGTDELRQVAMDLLEFMGPENIVVLKGGMGAGKTTFVKELGKVLDVEDNVSSPTFSIVNEYQTKGGETIYHFDFYRIKNQSEAYDLGFEDYLYSGKKCFIEWPEKVQGLLPGNYITVSITDKLNGSRIFTFQK